MGILKEGQVGAGSSCLVAVEQVIDAGIVLIDGLGHQAQSQDARVEVDVARRVGGDGGDVMNALELHPWSSDVVAHTTYQRTADVLGIRLAEAVPLRPDPVGV